MITKIKNNKDHEAALKRIEEIFEAEPNTPEGDELDVLATLVEAYEKEKYPILPPNPIEAIKFRADQMNIDKKELASILGGKNRLSEIFNKKRKLTLRMIRSLYEKLHIPAEILIQ